MRKLNQDVPRKKLVDKHSQCVDLIYSWIVHLPAVYKVGENVSGSLKTLHFTAKQESFGNKCMQSVEQYVRVKSFVN